MDVSPSKVSKMQAARYLSGFSMSYASFGVPSFRKILAIVHDILLFLVKTGLNLFWTDSIGYYAEYYPWMSKVCLPRL